MNRDKVGLEKFPLTRLYTKSFRKLNAEIPDKKLPFTETTSSPCYVKFLGIVFIVQKVNETDHLRIKESFRIKTPQEPQEPQDPQELVIKILQ